MFDDDRKAMVASIIVVALLWYIITRETI